MPIRRGTRLHRCSLRTDAWRLSSKMTLVQELQSPQFDEQSMTAFNRRVRQALR